MTGKGGSYKYTADLMILNSTHHRRDKEAIDDRMIGVSTPLKLRAWTQRMQSHPDLDFARYILEGIEHGFQIGVGEAGQIVAAKKNMGSAASNPGVIEEYITNECAKGNILGPFPPSILSKVHINRFGAIPKRHQPGKWRLITDLSFPEGSSVNDMIDPAICTLSYITVDEVAKVAIALGKGALIAKTDIKSAYRLVPIRPHDRRWLGMRWKDRVYIDGMLPFGLRSAPKIFNALADAMEWIVAQEGVDWIYHYLDDFALLGPPNSPDCQRALDTLTQVFDSLGVPLAPEKREGPGTTITFLGIVIDTVRQELRLPQDKLERLVTTVTQWGSKKACTRRELESLIGTIQHACKVIPAGRPFLRRAITLLWGVKCQHHHIRLNKEIRSDLQWWKQFAPHWNGASLIVHNNSKEFHVTSDASGSWGCGAWHDKSWFQLGWDRGTEPLHIAAKEMIPLVIASAIWGQGWKGGRVIAHCDNAAVVSIINSRSSKDSHLAQNNAEVSIFHGSIPPV